MHCWNTITLSSTGPTTPSKAPVFTLILLTDQSSEGGTHTFDEIIR